MEAGDRGRGGHPQTHVESDLLITKYLSFLIPMLYDAPTFCLFPSVHLPSRDRCILTRKHLSLAARR